MIDPKILKDWIRKSHQKSSGDNLTFLEYLYKDEKINLPEIVDFGFYQDVFERICEERLITAEWLLDYLIETGDLEALWDDANDLEDE